MARMSAQASLILKKLGKVDGMDAKLASAISKLIDKYNERNSEASEDDEDKPKAKRGRPAKAAKETATKAPGRRGRPPKAKPDDGLDDYSIAKLKKRVSKLGDTPENVMGRARTEEAQKKKLIEYIRENTD